MSKPFAFFLALGTQFVIQNDYIQQMRSLHRSMSRVVGKLQQTHSRAIAYDNRMPLAAGRVMTPGCSTSPSAQALPSLNDRSASIAISAVMAPCSIPRQGLCFGQLWWADENAPFFGNQFLIRRFQLPAMLTIQDGKFRTAACCL